MGVNENSKSSETCSIRVSRAMKSKKVRMITLKNCCPFCGRQKIEQITPASETYQGGVWKCLKCGSQFLGKDLLDELPSREKVLT